MTTKRSKFLTVLFALLPGAGHMFMGFMKTGLSLMAAFVLVIVIATVFYLSPVLFALPLIWFYAFFDCINKMSMPDERFAQEIDRYHFSLDTLVIRSKALRYPMYVGIALVLLGAIMLWESVWSRLSYYIIDQVRWAIDSVTRALPQVAVGVVIILIGIRLIAGRKRVERDV